MPYRKAIIEKAKKELESSDVLSNLILLRTLAALDAPLDKKEIQKKTEMYLKEYTPETQFNGTLLRYLFLISEVYKCYGIQLQPNKKQVLSSLLLDYSKTSEFNSIFELYWFAKINTNFSLNKNLYPELLTKTQEFKNADGGYMEARLGGKTSIVATACGIAIVVEFEDRK